MEKQLSMFDRPVGILHAYKLCSDGEVFASVIPGREQVNVGTLITQTVTHHFSEWMPWAKYYQWIEENNYEEIKDDI